MFTIASLPERSTEVLQTFRALRLQSFDTERESRALNQLKVTLRSRTDVMIVAPLEGRRCSKDGKGTRRL
jgi:hypothetical protein